MADVKPIRSEADYDTAVGRMGELMDAAPGTPEGDELEVLMALTAQYEEEHYPVELPDPISAIEFRMEQAELTPGDLVPILGSRAKVSEVLSGKRDITMAMARALHRHLGIPASALLQERGATLGPDSEDVKWDKFPLKEMAKRGWIPLLPDLKGHAEELVAELAARAFGGKQTAPAFLFRKTNNARANAKTDAYALVAWQMQMMAIVNEHPPITDYQPGTVTPSFLRELAQLSMEDSGPRLAQDLLAESGIALQVLSSLPRTYLDGAAFRMHDGRPVVGLTLRYDRIDNFWFCLLHELAHVGLHLDDGSDGFFLDDHDLRGKTAGSGAEREEEADRLASEALLPPAVWNDQEVATVDDLLGLAHRAGVHPAIVAGRIRYETGDYRRFSQFVGSGAVRRLFEKE